MLRNHYPHLEEKTGIPKSFPIVNFDNPESEAYGSWLKSINSKTHGGLSYKDYQKFWQDHRTQRGLELGVLWDIAYRISYLIGLHLHVNVHIQGVLGSWTEDIHKGTDGFIILPNGTKIPVDVTSNEQNISQKLQRVISKRGECLVYYIPGTTVHALAGALDRGLQKGSNVDDIISTHNNQSRTHLPKGTPIPINDSTGQLNTLRDVLTGNGTKMNLRKLLD